MKGGLTFPEVLRFRGEAGLAAAVTTAAMRERMKLAEWLRRVARETLARQGVELPPIPSDASTVPARDDDGPRPFRPGAGARPVAEQAEAA